LSEGDRKEGKKMAVKIVYIENLTGRVYTMYVLPEEVAEYQDRDGEDITILNIVEVGA
jgi:hypothetical protein